MVKIIMHGCNGHMGQVISGLVEKDPDAEIVAGYRCGRSGKEQLPCIYKYGRMSGRGRCPYRLLFCKKQQMHFLLTVRNANSRLYYVQPV